MNSIANVQVVQHADTTTQCAEVAARIAAQLQLALASRSHASLVLSGGRSPVPLFQTLSRLPLDWSRVRITLADERWVATSDEASNERLVRTHLLQAAAAKAEFVGLKNTAESARAGAAASFAALAPLPRPFDVVVLGMGDDGHFASLFPGTPGLDAALNPGAAPCCVATRAPVAPAERVSLNLAALLDSRLLLLPISGPAKALVYARAAVAGAAAELPVRALLAQRRVTLEVHISP